MSSEFREQIFVDITLSHVESKLAFFEMQIEVGTHDALKLHKTILGVTPKALNTIDVIPAIRPLHKLVCAVNQSPPAKPVVWFCEPLKAVVVEQTN